jgi:hypothetical protein
MDGREGVAGGGIEFDRREREADGSGVRNFLAKRAKTEAQPKAGATEGDAEAEERTRGRGSHSFGRLTQSIRLPFRRRTVHLLRKSETEAV